HRGRSMGFTQGTRRVCAASGCSCAAREVQHHRAGDRLAEAWADWDWELAVPPDFQDRSWDYAKFGRGERFVHQPIPHTEFAEIMAQVERWGPDQYLKEYDINRSIHTPAA